MERAEWWVSAHPGRVVVDTQRIAIQPATPQARLSPGAPIIQVKSQGAQFMKSPTSTQVPRAATKTAVYPYILLILEQKSVAHIPSPPDPLNRRCAGDMEPLARAPLALGLC